jgi:hypothetical protein
METKIALYENGVRIPQFIHYPAKINAGTKFDAPVSTIDIGATMMDFAGIVPSYELDGKSWKDAVGDASQELSWKNNRCLFSSFSVIELLDTDARSTWPSTNSVLRYLPHSKEDIRKIYLTIVKICLIYVVLIHLIMLLILQRTWRVESGMYSPVIR